jgi:hypothetical protein
MEKDKKQVIVMGVLLVVLISLLIIFFYKNDKQINEVMANDYHNYFGDNGLITNYNCYKLTKKYNEVIVYFKKIETDNYLYITSITDQEVHYYLLGIDYNKAKKQWPNQTFDDKNKSITIDLANDYQEIYDDQINLSDYMNTINNEYQCGVANE